MAKKQQEMNVSVAEVVDYMRFTGQFLKGLHDVVERKLAIATARRKGLKVTPKELQKAADAFRVANGLNKASLTEKWMSSRGITVEALEDYLETNLLISMLKDDLEKKAAKTKYLKSNVVKETVREMIYRDWLKTKMK